MLACHGAGPGAADGAGAGMSDAELGGTSARRTRRSSASRTSGRSAHGTLIASLLLILFNLALHAATFATLQTLNVNLTQVCTIVIVGVGMTLVIATGGIDLSVGSLMAIAGALAPLIFLGRPSPRLRPLSASRWPSSCRCWSAGALRPVQRLAGHPLPHPADHRHAGAVHRRARHRPGHDQRQPPGLQHCLTSSRSASAAFGVPFQVI